MDRSDTDRKPDSLGARSPASEEAQEQGLEPRSGSHSAHGEEGEELAQRGAPDSEHAPHGREDVPGDRPGNRT